MPRICGPASRCIKASARISQGLPAWFIEQLHLPENGRILEVGCGPGGYWPEVAESIPPSWHITVSDFSPGMVAQARQRLAMLDRPFTVVQADVQSLPFPDGAFDAVIANFMLYHVPDRPRALAEIRRVLAAGGRLHAMTNGDRHMQEFKALVNRVVPGTIRQEELGFSLENGAVQLAPWFDEVRLVRYPGCVDRHRDGAAPRLCPLVRGWAQRVSGGSHTPAD